VTRTISDLWLVIHSGCPLNIRAPVFSSRQIEGEVVRANAEHRSGRTDWVAVDLDVSGDEEARISGAFVLRGRFLDDG
jgi:predicted lipoprotein